MKLKYCVIAIFLIASLITGCGGNQTPATPDSSSPPVSDSGSVEESEAQESDNSVASASDGAVEFQEEKAFSAACEYKVSVPVLVPHHKKATNGSQIYVDTDRLYVFVVGGYLYAKETPYEDTDIKNAPGFLDEHLLKSCTHYTKIDVFSTAGTEGTIVTKSGREMLRIEQPTTDVYGGEWLYIGYYTLVDNPDMGITNGPAYFGVFAKTSEGADVELAAKNIDAMADTFELATW